MNENPLEPQETEDRPQRRAQVSLPFVSYGGFKPYR